MMNNKTKKFNEFLSKSKITCFNSQEIDNEMHAVLYRSFMKVSGQNIPTMVVLDDSIYAIVQVCVAVGVVKDANKNCVMEHINELNGKYKVFKYYINDNGDIVIESCIPATDD
ncbi:MAG: YbjN domain-containing protein [Phascolarctobacterium sp.]|nr:YbjN domain-containing protein [Phascolarctobacterium sp.]